MAQTLLHLPDRARRFLPQPWADQVLVALTLALILVGVAWAVVSLVALARRRARGPGHGPEDLGHPYDLVLETTELRLPLRLTVGSDSMSFEVTGPFAKLGDLDPPLPARVPLADVRQIELKPSRVVLHAETPAGEQAVALVPRTYADRQRFVWEMAVRIPDLFDAAGRDPATPAAGRRIGARLAGPALVVALAVGSAAGCSGGSSMEGELYATVVAEGGGAAVSEEDVRARALVVDMALGELGIERRSVLPLPGGRLRIVIPESQVARLPDVRKRLEDPKLRVRVDAAPAR